MPLLSLQYLRAIAAFMVVCVHLQLQVQRMGYGGGWPDWAASGVDIFFVLSGFLMWSTTAGRAQGPLEFYRRRIVRIVPLYWLLTTVVVVVAVGAPQLMQSVRFDGFNVLGSYLFFFTPAANGRLEPVLVVGWTLNYEMLFYLLYGAALLLPERWRFAATASAIAALVALGFNAVAVSSLGQAYTSSIMLEFVWGMALAAWWLRLPRQAGSPWSGVILLVTGFAGLAVFWGAAGPRALTAGVPAVMVVAGGLLWERSGTLPRMPALRWMGDSSYSLYLSHAIVLSAFSQVWRKLGWHLIPGGLWLFCIAAVVVSIAVGGLVYRWLELPLTRRFGGFTGARIEPRTR